MLSQPPATPSRSPQAGKDDTQVVILATFVAVLIIVAVGAVFYFTLRWRAYQSEHDPECRPIASTAVDKTHVAARITPFASQPNLIPQFNHRPGIDMRIATRRADGAWEFSHPNSPFNPLGVTEIEPVCSKILSIPPTPSSPEPPTPSSPEPRTPSSPEPRTPSSPEPRTPSSLEPPKSPAAIMKERESQAARLIREGYDAREFSDVLPPPPAYGHDSSYRDDCMWQQRT
ncbi:hypothetical protein APHAL10511_004678 [Amanita phalloides]|nr:hypothetical protein APHAL10511_004678 [Amanita phalloides]